VWSYGRGRRLDGFERWDASWRQLADPRPVADRLGSSKDRRVIGSIGGVEGPVRAGSPGAIWPHPPHAQHADLPIGNAQTGAPLWCPPPQRWASFVRHLSATKRFLSRAVGRSYVSQKMCEQLLRPDAPTPPGGRRDVPGRRRACWLRPQGPRLAGGGSAGEVWLARHRCGRRGRRCRCLTAGLAADAVVVAVEPVRVGRQDRKVRELGNVVTVDVGQTRRNAQVGVRRLALRLTFRRTVVVVVASVVVVVACIVVVVDSPGASWPPDSDGDRDD
jgi:hypothetical protein